MKKLISFLNVILLKVILAQRSKGWGIVGNPLLFSRPCDGNDDINVIFESGLPPGEENQYKLQIREKFLAHSKVNLKFDSDVSITLGDNSTARIRANPQIQSFTVHFFKKADLLHLDVKGPPFGGVPYVQSIDVNNVEYCEKPKIGYLDDYIIGIKDTAELSTDVLDDSCGRRKIQHTELIVNGLSTKPGDWPWHAAVYRLEKSKIDYICGGTLLSKSFILTAAHCVTSKGQVVLPETRNVVLGKYNLAGGDIAPQEREIHKIFAHENFKYPNLDNDIAFMKMKTEIVFSDYVQPACIWNSDVQKKIPEGTIHGTVVGWGFDNTDSLSTTLQQVTIPMQNENKCIKSNPLFFTRLLNNNKFCAGYSNGTSACNGDSGGAFLVFVPDVSGNLALNASGAWYVRGIVSLSVSRRDVPICDPNEYTIFTDTAKYKSWIAEKMLQ